MRFILSWSERGFQENLFISIFAGEKPVTAGEGREFDPLQKKVYSQETNHKGKVTLSPIFPSHSVVIEHVLSLYS